MVTLGRAAFTCQKQRSCDGIDEAGNAQGSSRALNYYAGIFSPSSFKHRVHNAESDEYWIALCVADFS